MTDRETLVAAGPGRVGVLPAVTVVIPTHNRPELMRRAVQSVLEQEYSGEIEIIVVFDACPVELPDVPAREGRTLAGVGNSRSRGLAGARNSGILAARHDFVAFLDDDDHWLQGKLARQMPLFERRPELLMVGTAMLVDDGSTTHDRLVPVSPVTRADLVADRLTGLHSSSFVLRRSALLGPVGLIDEELPRSYGEDYDLLLRAASLGPIEVVNEPLVSVRWQGQSYFFGRWALYAQALQYLLDKHPEFAESRRGIARIEAQVAFALAASDQGREARAWAKRSLAHHVRQPKAVLAIAISLHLVSAERIARVAQRFGRGI